MFDRLIHSDWSRDPRKRWRAAADRHDETWHVGEPVRVGPSKDLLDTAFDLGADRRVLLGFDFPIGLPAAYGAMTGLAGFKEALPIFGTGSWSEFFDVADHPDEISIRRPFYPRRSAKGVRRGALASGLGVSTFHDLFRACEHRTASTQAACSLFWTLGGNQVGKGAIDGWREVIRPAVERDAALWPFDGQLAELALTPGIVIAETYPALSYDMVGARFRGSESKRRQGDRRSKAGAILDWARVNRISFSDTTREYLLDGFGPSPSGEDAFDALLGLLKMIEVCDGRRPEATQSLSSPDPWEGWIIGR
jgi:hypothetical protein